MNQRPTLSYLTDPLLSSSSLVGGGWRGTETAVGSNGSAPDLIWWPVCGCCWGASCCGLGGPPVARPSRLPSPDSRPAANGATRQLCVKNWGFRRVTSSPLFAGCTAASTKLVAPAAQRRRESEPAYVTRPFPSLFNGRRVKTGGAAAGCLMQESIHHAGPAAATVQLQAAPIYGRMHSSAQYVSLSVFTRPFFFFRPRNVAGQPRLQTLSHCWGFSCLLPQGLTRCCFRFILWVTVRRPRGISS